MIGFGAFVKSIAGALGCAGVAAILGLRLALGARRPVLCPIPIPANTDRRGR